MKKRIKITVIAVCVLLMCLTVTTALAETVYSKATVNYGNIYRVKGPVRTLTSVKLSGNVVSYASSTGTAYMFGGIYTQGDILINLRDSDSVLPGDSVTLSWANTGAETGTFFAEAQASSGNHNGYGQASQVH